MSGAVSDNQIARLGQQFGVRYVLVADVSEVFESMFISARMIDVQTAQITNSTEADAVVDNMESLSKISETIVFRLFNIKKYAKDEIKIIGPFSTVKELRECQYDENIYHIATQDEIEKIINSNHFLNNKTYFPIYAELKIEYISHPEYWFAYHDSEGYREGPIERYYIECTMSCLFIAAPNSYEPKTYSDIDDSYGNYMHREMNKDGWRTTGLFDHSSNPSITAGYVYLIKSEE